MKSLRKNIILLLLLLMSNMAAMAATKVYVADFTITGGTEQEISICLNTEFEDIDLIEGTIEFPSQLLVMDNAYSENGRVKADDQRASGFIGNYNPDTRAFKLQAVSSTIATGDGAIAYMKVRATTDIAASSTVTLSNFRIRHKSGDYEDVTAANAAVTGKQETSTAISLQYMPASLSLLPGGKGTVDFQVQTTGNITGLQGVFTVGDGITIINVEKGDAAGSPTIVNYNATNGNFVYFGSLDNISGALLTLEMEAAEDFSSETITFSSIVATDARSVRITLDDVTMSVSANNATGITAASEGCEGKDAYNLSGQKVNDNYKGIVIRNGKKMLVK